MLHAAPARSILHFYFLPIRRIGLVAPPEPPEDPQTGPASVVNVSLSENHPWIPVDCDEKNHEKNANSCR